MNRVYNRDPKVNKMEEPFINQSKDIIILPKKDLTVGENKVNRKVLPTYWDRDYINQQLELITNHQHKMLFVFLWRTGVRISEALNLRKKDIDFNNYMITVKWQKSRKYIERTIPIQPPLKDMLQMYTATLNLEDKVFPITRQRSWQLAKKYFKGNPHKFRHSFAVNWLKCGGDIWILKKYLGHSKLEFTTIYLNIIPIDQGKELMKVEF